MKSDSIYPDRKKRQNEATKEISARKKTATLEV